MKLYEIIMLYAKPEFLDVEIDILKDGKVISDGYNFEEEVIDYGLYTDVFAGKRYLFIEI